MKRIAILIAVAAASFAAPALAAQPAPNAQAVARGKAAYDRFGCYECHGYAGQGAGPTGAALAPAVKPLAYYQAYVRRPTAVMPPYSQAILPDPALEDIHAYLSAIPPGKPAADIPLLSGR